MEDSTQEFDDKNLTFVLYEDQAPPRYFELKKIWVKLFVYVLPILTISALISLFFVGLYFKEIKMAAKRKEPAVINLLKKEKAELKLSMSNIEALNLDLEKRLAQGATGIKALESDQILFAPAPGQKDITHTRRLSIEKVKISQNASELRINYDLVNTSEPHEKVAGYIFALLKTQNQLHVWPKSALDGEKLNIAFNTGEIFATSRFRSGVISFNIPKSSKSYIIKFLIFSRSGDLMAKRLIKYPEPGR